MKKSEMTKISRALQTALLHQKQLSLLLDLARFLPFIPRRLALSLE